MTGNLFKSPNTSVFMQTPFSTLAYLEQFLLLHILWAVPLLYGFSVSWWGPDIFLIEWPFRSGSQNYKVFYKYFNLTDPILLCVQLLLLLFFSSFLLPIGLPLFEFNIVWIKNLDNLLIRIRQIILSGLGFYGKGWGSESFVII